MEELTAAVQSGTNVVLLTKEGARWKDAAGAATQLFPPAAAYGHLRPEVQEVFSRKSVQHSDE